MRCEVLSRHLTTAILYARLHCRERRGLHAGRRNPTAFRRTRILRGLAPERFAWLAVALAGIRVAVHPVTRPRARIRGTRGVDGAPVFRAGNGGAVPGIPMDRAARCGLGADKRLR